MDPQKFTELLRRVDDADLDSDSDDSDSPWPDEPESDYYSESDDLNGLYGNNTADDIRSLKLIRAKLWPFALKISDEIVKTNPSYAFLDFLDINRDDFNEAIALIKNKVGDHDIDKITNFILGSSRRKEKPLTNHAYWFNIMLLDKHSDTKVVSVRACNNIWETTLNGITMLATCYPKVSIPDIIEIQENASEYTPTDSGIVVHVATKSTIFPLQFIRTSGETEHQRSTACFEATDLTPKNIPPISYTSEERNTLRAIHKLWPHARQIAVTLAQANSHEPFLYPDEEDLTPGDAPFCSYVSRMTDVDYDPELMFNLIKEHVNIDNQDEVIAFIRDIDIESSDEEDYSSGSDYSNSAHNKPKEYVPPRTQPPQSRRRGSDSCTSDEGDEEA